MNFFEYEKIKDSGIYDVISNESALQNTINLYQNATLKQGLVRNENLPEHYLPSLKGKFINSIKSEEGQIFIANKLNIDEATKVKMIMEKSNGKPFFENSRANDFLKTFCVNGVEQKNIEKLEATVQEFNNNPNNIKRGLKYDIITSSLMMNIRGKDYVIHEFEEKDKNLLYSNDENLINGINAKVSIFDKIIANKYIDLLNHSMDENVFSYRKLDNDTIAIDYRDENGLNTVDILTPEKLRESFKNVLYNIDGEKFFIDKFKNTDDLVDLNTMLFVSNLLKNIEKTNGILKSSFLKEGEMTSKITYDYNKEDNFTRKQAIFEGKFKHFIKNSSFVMGVVLVAMLKNSVLANKQPTEKEKNLVKEMMRLNGKLILRGVDSNALKETLSILETDDKLAIKERAKMLEIILKVEKEFTNTKYFDNDINALSYIPTNPKISSKLLPIITFMLDNERIRDVKEKELREEELKELIAELEKMEKQEKKELEELALKEQQLRNLNVRLKEIEEEKKKEKESKLNLKKIILGSSFIFLGTLFNNKAKTDKQQNVEEQVDYSNFDKETTKGYLASKVRYTRDFINKALNSMINENDGIVDESTTTIHEVIIDRQKERELSVLKNNMEQNLDTIKKISQENGIVVNNLGDFELNVKSINPTDLAKLLTTENISVVNKNLKIHNGFNNPHLIKIRKELANNIENNNIVNNIPIKQQVNIINEEIKSTLTTTTYKQSELETILNQTQEKQEETTKKTKKILKL